MDQQEEWFRNICIILNEIIGDKNDNPSISKLTYDSKINNCTKELYFNKRFGNYLISAKIRNYKYSDWVPYSEVLFSTGYSEVVYHIGQFMRDGEWISIPIDYSDPSSIKKENIFKYLNNMSRLSFFGPANKQFKNLVVKSIRLDKLEKIKSYLSIP